jgi:hypothetical protein
MKGDKELKMLCCACRNPIRQAGEEFRYVALDFKAGWEYPRTTSGKAIALLCQKCGENGALPKFAIEWDGKQESPKYHLISQQTKASQPKQKPTPGNQKARVRGEGREEQLKLL